MKLELRGHDERYVVEQSLMNLFPGEKPSMSPLFPGMTAGPSSQCRKSRHTAA